MFRKRLFREKSGLISVVFLLIAMLFFWDTVFAELPRQTFFQARLRLKNGGFIVEPQNLTFRLYETSSGGSSIWSETQEITPDSTGVISCYLGSSAAFPGTIDFNQVLYLSIQVGSDVEMSPRIKIAPQTSALNASRLDGLISGQLLRSDVDDITTGSLTFSGVTQDITTGTNEHLSLYPNGTGNVGIGTTSPSLFKLEVAGSVGPTDDFTYNLGSSTYRWNNIYANNISGTITPIGFDSGGMIFGGTGGMLVQDTANIFWNNTTNRLGIGTSSPGTILDVIGTIRSNSQLISTVSMGTAPLAVSSGTLVSNLNADMLDGFHSGDFLPTGTDNWVDETGDTMAGTLTFSGVTTDITTAGNEDLTLIPGGAGNVGVGTTSPAEKLDVAGITRTQALEVIGSTSTQNLDVAGTATTQNLTIGTLSGALKATSGVVSGPATTDDVTEGLNLYFTTERARYAITASSPLVYSPLTGLIDLDTIKETRWDGAYTHSQATSNVHGLIFTGEGEGGGLDADYLDGLDSIDFMSVSADEWVNETGDVMSGPLVFSGTTVDIITSGNENLVFLTPGTTGRVGIGSSFPLGKLTIRGAGTGTGYALEIMDNALTDKVVVLDNGNVGIGIIPPTEALDINGRIKLAQVSAPSVTTDKLYNDSGNLYWNAARLNSPGGILPIGSSGQTLRHDGGSWASSSLLYNDSTGIGIGTTAPAAKLEIKGAGTGTTFALKIQDSEEVDKLAILDNGNVGIATTAPGYKLDVAGTFSADSVNVNSAYTLPAADGTINYILKTNGAGTVSWAEDDDTVTAAAGDDGQVQYNNSDTFAGATSLYYNDSTNRLGIGTTAPAAKLEIKGAGTGTTFALKIQDSEEADKLAILDNGNVGIATTAPGYKLDVAGTFSADSVNVNSAYTLPAADGTIDYILKTNGAGTVSWAEDDDTVTNPNGEDGAVQYNNGGSTFGGSANLLFLNDTSGNVGIGTSLPNDDLHIYRTAQETSISIDGQVDQDQSLYFGYPASSVTFGIVRPAASDDLRIWHTTGGDLVTFDDGGDVGIGKTNPATKLDVNGVITATGGISTNWNTAYTNRVDNWTSPLAFSSNTVSLAGLSGLGTGNYLLGANAGATGWEYKQLLGTTNRITVSHGVGSVTLNTPQDIHTGASPTFAGLNTTGIVRADGGFQVDGFQVLSADGYELDLTRGDTSKIHSLGTLSFDWTAGSYDTPDNHGITSKSEAGAFSDSLRINSYGDIINTIDSNANSTSYFKVQKESTGNGTDLFTVDETGLTYILGNVGIGTVSPNAKLHVAGGAGVDGLISATSNLNSYNLTRYTPANNFAYGVNMSIVAGSTNGTHTADGKFVFNSTQNTWLGGFVSDTSYARVGERALEWVVDTSNAGVSTAQADHLMIGFGDSSLAANNYSHLPHAIYFNKPVSGAYNLAVYEDGTSRVSMVSLTWGDVIHCRIVLKSTGADYYYKINNGDWQFGYEGTYSSETPLYPSVAPYAGRWTVHSLHVYDGDRTIDFDNGNVGIGTTNPGTKLDVNGVITATGGTSTDWNSASSSSHTRGHTMANTL
ncbi:MAG: hypothetical protein ABIG56_06360, partial [Candidatus Omnitrophota bacterium]